MSDIVEQMMENHPDSRKKSSKSSELDKLVRDIRGAIKFMRKMNSSTAQIKTAIKDMGLDPFAMPRTFWVSNEFIEYLRKVSITVHHHKGRTPVLEPAFDHIFESLALEMAERLTEEERKILVRIPAERVALSKSNSKERHEKRRQLVAKWGKLLKISI